jgi:hypothetical protein
MSAAHRVEYYVTPEMTDPAVRASLASRGMALPPTLLARAGRVIWLLALAGMTYYTWSVHGSDWVVFVGSAAVLLLFGMYLLEHRYHRRLRAAFRESVARLEGKPVVWVFRDDGITLSSALGTRDIPWPTVRDLFNDFGFWMLAEASGQVTAIPADALTGPAERFLLDKARAAGAAVRPPTDTIEDDYDDVAVGRLRTR